MDEKAVRALFALLASALNNAPIGDAERCLIDGETVADAMRIAKRQDIVALVVHALEENGLVPESGEIREIAERETMSSFVRYERSNYELHAVSRALEQAGIAHIPLKGSVLRDYYHEPWLRTSCDIDILVSVEELSSAVECIVSTLGYTVGERGSHDVSMRSRSGVHLELHFDLNERDYRRFDALDAVWDYATAREGKRYAMSMPDDLFYFYHISHMAKHFVNGGCGVRPFIDLWIMRHREGFDLPGAERLLRDEGLYEFAVAAAELSEVWFSGADADERTSTMERYLLGGGVYGSVENRVHIQQAKRGGRFKYALSRIFLPYEQMKGRYPVLEKHKWLLPFMHVRRWLGIIFGGGFKRSVDELRTNSEASSEEIDEMKLFLSKVGL